MRRCVALVMLLGWGMNLPAGEAATGERLREALGGAVMAMAPEVIYVAPQEFIMGSPPHAPGFKADQLQHPVRLSAYYIGAYEVTNAEYCVFLNERGNRLDSGIRWVLTDRETCLIREGDDGVFAPVEGAADKPVVSVSWRGALAYCDWLGEHTGARYRLPTEAEWECAARAGTTTVWPWGDRFEGGRLQWSGSDTQAMAPVGSYPANPWGLHDTVGNAWEFVVDCVEQDFYQRSPVQDPVHFVAACWTPGIRGGSFSDGPNFCHPGYRINTWWWGAYDNVGFRVAREVEPTRWYRRREHRRRPAPPTPVPTPEQSEAGS